MNNRTYRHSGSRLLMTGTLLTVAAGVFISATYGQLGGFKRARMAKDLNNIRQITIACHSFANDFDGAFPNKKTAKEFGVKTTFSNDYFRQFFLERTIENEEIFWIKKATICNPAKPDNLVAKEGKFLLEEILKPGDCGWAYMTEQTIASNGSRPLVVVGYKDGTKTFDLDLHDGKVMLARIDGSASSLEPNADGKIVDSGGVDLLSAKAAPWKDSKQDPAKLLVQPAPAPKPDPDPKQAEE